MSKVTLVIADNQPLMRLAMKQSLEVHEDFQVVGEAANVDDAVRLTCDLRPNVVILEVGIPKLGGVEATRRIKKSCPATSVLVLTAHDEYEHVAALLGAGANGYLLKTVSSDTLVQAVRSVHSGEMVLQPAVCHQLLNRAIGRRSPSSRQRASDRLTSRELEVLRLVAMGMRNEGIASQLGIGVRTVKGHMVDIFAKMSVRSRTEAAFQALKRGYINIDVEDVS